MEAVTVCCICDSTFVLVCFVSETTIASVVALSAISLIERESSSTVTFNSCMDFACTDAESYIPTDRLLVVSDCSDTLSEISWISYNIPRMESRKCRTLLPICPISSLPLTLTSTVKSPSAIVVIVLVSLRTGLTTRCIIRSTKTTRTKRATTAITTIFVRRLLTSA